jgi:two-component system, OmpR family, sensor histidine kinase VicK
MRLLAVITEANKEEEKTELLYGIENAVSRGAQFMQNVKIGMDLFGDKNGPSIIIEYDVYKNNYIDVIRRGGKIRLITEITKENIHYCKELMKIVTELRHLDGLVGGIAVSESEYMTTTTLKQKQLLTQVFYSNATEIVKQGQYVFDTFWNKAIPAKQRIKEIEKGAKREFIETIRESTEIRRLVRNLIQSATEEIVILFSTASNTFRSSQDYQELLELLKEVSSSHHQVSIRILVDREDPINKILQNFKEEKEEAGKPISIEYRNKKAGQSKITILIVDNAYSLTIEMKDSLARSFDEAIGLATYSNSESTVSTYLSIFETLWIQSEMYEEKEEEEIIK